MYLVQDLLNVRPALPLHLALAHLALPDSELIPQVHVLPALPTVLLALQALCAALLSVQMDILYFQPAIQPITLLLVTLVV